MSDYLSGAYRPVHDERTDRGLRIEGELPRDLRGTFLQNSPNPRWAPRGRHHWFDGEGMVHAVALEDGGPTYRNRYIRTDDWVAEAEAGGPLWGGILDPFDPDGPRAPDRETANTDLIWHNGRLLALLWLGGRAWELGLPELETLGPAQLAGLDCGMLAHPKTCPRTGELVFIDSNLYQRPYLAYGVLSADGSALHRVELETPRPSFFHDIAITERFTVIPDMPLCWDPSRLPGGKRRVAFDPDEPGRFGVIPRHGEAADVRWFEVPACYIFHTVNAWEEGSLVHLVAHRVRNPFPTRPHDEEPTVPRLAFIRLEPYLVHWTFDLETGAVTETQVDDLASEFPRVDPRTWGTPSRHVFSQRLAPERTLFFDGVAKVDLQRGTRQERSWGPGRVGSETVFVPRGAEDDDGWLLSLVLDRADETSALEVLDAQTLDRACRIHLPRRVPFGFHTHWAGVVPGMGIQP